VSHFRTLGRSAAWVALPAVAALFFTGCTRAVAGAPVKSNALLSVDLGTVLLDPAEVGDVMGTSGLVVLDEGNGPDDTIDASPAKCHGVVYIAGETEYAPTNFTAMRWQTVGAPGVGSVVELVAQLPSVAKADEFIDKQTKAWQGCADETITATEKVKRSSVTQYRVTAVRARPHIVTASTRVVSSDMRCQHVVQAVSNVIIEASACGNNVSDQAEAIAEKLAEKVAAG